MAPIGHTGDHADPNACPANGRHQWRETYYGYECYDCLQFIPYGCEPWAPDDEGDGQDWSDELE